SGAVRRLALVELPSQSLKFRVLGEEHSPLGAVNLTEQVVMSLLRRDQALQPAENKGRQFVLPRRKLTFGPLLADNFIGGLLRARHASRRASVQRCCQRRPLFGIGNRKSPAWVVAGARYRSRCSRPSRRFRSCG